MFIGQVGSWSLSDESMSFLAVFFCSSVTVGAALYTKVFQPISFRISINSVAVSKMAPKMKFSEG